MPAGSVAVTLRLFTPSGNVDVVALHCPLASTTAVAMTLPAASLMVMVSPGMPVPLMVGVLSLVLPSPTVPVSLLLASAADGAAGAVVSMVMGSVVAAPVLPAGSVAVMLRVLTHSGKAVVGVADQVPSGATVAVAMTVPAASLMVMVSPAKPVP